MIQCTCFYNERTKVYNGNCQVCKAPDRRRCPCGKKATAKPRCRNCRVNKYRRWCGVCEKLVLSSPCLCCGYQKDEEPVEFCSICRKEERWEDGPCCDPQHVRKSDLEPVAKSARLCDQCKHMCRVCERAACCVCFMSSNKICRQCSEKARDSLEHWDTEPATRKRTKCDMV